jgi:hypothetical protein
MAESQLPEYLQFHGQSRNTGCLTVAGAEESAAIYLLDGEIVYAESGPYQGLVAVYRAMRWDQAAISWEEGLLPGVVRARHSIDAVLFQYAQLEDTGQTDDATLMQLFAEESVDDENIRLMDLGQYQICFEVLNTAFRGFVFYLEKAISLVGRGEDCDIILPDASVSSHHCKIMLEKHCLRVVDLGSTNGTRINGEIIAERILQPGDSFQIGTVMVALQLKLKRNLDASKVADAARNLQKTIVPAASVHTQKIDPKALQKAPKKITGPITWKNLTGDVAGKKESNSLFSKMFTKK